jgi:hypothetical protein
MALSFAVNYIGVLVAALVSFMFGWMWFGPVFGKIWMKAMKISPREAEEMSKNGVLVPIFLGFILALIGSYVIAVLIASLGIVTVKGALLLGLIIWLGFFFTTHFGNNMWENKHLNIFYLYIGQDLCRILIICLILVLM